MRMHEGEAIFSYGNFGPHLTAEDEGDIISS